MEATVQELNQQTAELIAAGGGGGILDDLDSAMEGFGE